jgi:hypothetical protein
LSASSDVGALDVRRARRQQDEKPPAGAGGFSQGGGRGWGVYPTVATGDPVSGGEALSHKYHSVLVFLE